MKTPRTATLYLVCLVSIGVLSAIVVKGLSEPNNPNQQDRTIDGQKVIEVVGVAHVGKPGKQDTSIGLVVRDGTELRLLKSQDFPLPVGLGLPRYLLQTARPD